MVFLLNRAAVGITEESDAVVVVVSEETGAISLVYAGVIQYGLDSETLQEELEKVLKRKYKPRADETTATGSHPVQTG